MNDGTDQSSHTSTLGWGELSAAHSSRLFFNSLCVPPSLLSIGYQGLFLRGKAARSWSWSLTF